MWHMLSGVLSSIWTAHPAESSAAIIVFYSWAHGERGRLTFFATSLGNAYEHERQPFW
jgi:hypothetical protein